VRERDLGAVEYGTVEAIVCLRVAEVGVGPRRIENCRVVIALEALRLRAEAGSDGVVVVVLLLDMRPELRI